MKKLCAILLSVLFSYGLSAQTAASVDKEKLFDLYQNQRYNEAANYLKGIYGEQIVDVKTLSQIGYCYLMSGNNVEAEKFYLKAYQQQAQNLPVLFSLASINSRRGQVEKAKLYYGEIVKIDSTNFTVYKQLAALYASNTDTMKLGYLKKANLINPVEGEVAYDLADVYVALQQREKAYKVLNVAMAADSGNIILQKALLPVANALKKYNEVIFSGEKILKVDKDALVIKDVAKAYYYTKNYAQAASMFKLIEAMGLQNEATLYYTALCYRAMKNFPLATTYTKKTIDEAISSNTADYYALLGLIYEETAKLAQAQTAYKKGLEFKATPTIYYRLALLYDTKYNQAKQAEKYYLLYLKSRPNAEIDKDEIKYVKARMEQLKTVD